MADFKLPETASQAIAAVSVAVAPRRQCVSNSIYVIGFATRLGPVKIGIADKPDARLKQLQTASPYELALLYSEDVGPTAWMIEGDVHWHLANKRVRGEWFDVSVDVAIAAIQVEKVAVEPEPPKRVLIPGKLRGLG